MSRSTASHHAARRAGRSPLHPPRRHPFLLASAVATLATASLAACGSDDDAGPAEGGATSIVVTYAVLGDVVQRLVGDVATVRVIIPNGQDPHEYEPSAKDVEAIQSAGLVVENGFDLEEGLAGVLDQAADDGVAVFVATDHVTLRELGAGEPTDDHAGEGEDDHAGEGEDDHAGEDDHGTEDPHIWTDPLTMAEMAPALSAALEGALGVSLDEQLAVFQAEMTALDTEVRGIMAAVPAGDCKLVTGHDSLGYFAERYGCTVIGAVIPSLSSSAETSAQALAELHDLAASAGVRAVFTELGTPAQIAEQVADEVGVPLVELPSHILPDTGGYPAFITDLATRVASALAP